MTDDATLLQQFVDGRGESDFAQLVERHIGMVLATALRRVGGDAHLAQDVAQTVFIDLARKAPALAHHRVLAGWLHTSTVYAAAKAVRSALRRRRREEHAHAMQETNHDSASDADWARVRPVLDDALQSLSTRDRDAILLRFFNAQGFAAIGASLHVSENAARMRVERALDKLRAQLARRGIASTLAALGTVLTTHAAVTAPPAALAATITTTALAGASGAGATVALFNLLAMTKIQLGLTAAVVAVGATTLALEQREQTELRASLPQAAALADESAQLRAEIERLRQAAPDSPTLQLETTANELAAVRREAADLRERRAQLEPAIAAAARPPARPSASAANSPDALSLAALDQMPRFVHTVPPVYPSALAAAAIPGEVVLSFIVDAQGHVQDIKVVETTHPNFVAPALDAVRQWEFSSGRKGGKAVNTRVNQVVVFQIENPNWF